MRKAYILLADGFECVEALAPIDVMHRAGVDLRRVAVGHRLDVISSHGLMTLVWQVTLRPRATPAAAKTVGAPHIAATKAPLSK